METFDFCFAGFVAYENHESFTMNTCVQCCITNAKALSHYVISPRLCCRKTFLPQNVSCVCYIC